MRFSAKPISGLILASAAGLLSSAAQAELISIGDAQIQFANPIFQSTGSDRVRLYYPNAAGNERSMVTNAGRFSGSATTDDFNADIFYEDADLVYMYCVDLYQSVSSGWNVGYDVHQLTDTGANTLTTRQHPERDFDRTLSFLGALNYTLAESYSDLGFGQSNYNWLNPTANWMSGAIQLGIWESLYEDVGNSNPTWDIGSGDFRVASNGGSGNTMDSRGAELLARTFANIGTDGVDALGTQYALVLTSDSYQDVIAGDPPAGVSAPGTVGLMAAGLALFRRRRS